ncbi:hypothetical protein RR46_01417 [Papilio xuthus]|uniref:TIL domain-containing protein n=1 Tax=Papilio xuthus TaxID=66420 RepID=A0A0N0P9K1_PAPXU|nr:hypothetical protein RR46_01417 [Papilio xuthus]
MVYSEPLRDYRGCQYIHGICVRECEEGTKAYVRDCDYAKPEATCDVPNPEVDLRGKICDYSQCYCEEPTVRDPITKKCVKLEDCTKSN